jgi:hypothetical protein
MRKQKYEDDVEIETNTIGKQLSQLNKKIQQCHNTQNYFIHRKGLKKTTFII